MSTDIFKLARIGVGLQTWRQMVSLGSLLDWKQIAMSALTKHTIDVETQRTTSLFISRISAQYDISETLLFGSRSRASHLPTSDADLAVVLKGKHGDRSAAVKDMAALAFHVMMETGVMVEALPLWDDEIREPEIFSNAALIKNILRDGIRL